MVLTETTRQCQHYLIPKALELKFQFSTNIFISASITDNKNSRPKKSRRATRKSTGKSATRQDTRTALGGALSTTLSASFVDTENTVTPIVTVEEDPEKARQKSEDRSGSEFSLYSKIWIFRNLTPTLSRDLRLEFVTFRNWLALNAH